jgi:hypothetical protein
VILEELEQNIFLQKIHGQIKEHFQNSSQEYKHRVDQHHRELQFEVGDQVLAYLKKESFPRGTYNKLKMKKIGPCKVLRKFDANAYEIDLTNDVAISPIFNISYVYPYRGDQVGETKDQKEIQLEKKIHVAENS